MSSSSNSLAREDIQDTGSVTGALRSGRLKVIVVASLAAVVLLAASVWEFGPGFQPDVLDVLRRIQTPVRIYSDETGEPVWLERTYDYQWRFQIPLEKMSPAVKTVMLAVEDRRFYEHHGIDWQAASRAFFQMLLHGRIISGASTITMQLAGQTDPPCRRTWMRKFYQILRARKLEQLYDKDTILAEYLNRISFGGKIYGIEAAARYYYGKSSSELTLDEAAMLCGIPQRPEKQRPDKHPDAALERHRIVLEMMERQGILQPGESQVRLENARTHFRNFSRDRMFDGLGSNTSDFSMYLAQARKEVLALEEKQHGTICHDVRTCLAVEKQALLVSALQHQVQQHPGVRDGAGVLMDSRTGAVLALVGTLDLSSPRAGQVNGAIASRVAGSTLKPFFYAEAISGGIICADTLMLDAPMRYGTYRPGNFSGEFRGWVSAEEALSSSLNIPAVELLSQLGVSRMAEVLAKMGLVSDVKAVTERDGLAMALGSSGHTLLQLTAAYTALAHGGLYSAPHFTEKGAEPIRIFNEGAVAMVNRMLRKRSIPGCSHDVAWKTGTSNGFHDAWCIAYTGDYVLGIWFGNKEGQADASLVGATIALPCAGDVFEALYRMKAVPVWNDNDGLLRPLSLCRASGLRPGDSCKDVVNGTCVAELPLRKCTICGKKAASKTMILSPEPVVYTALASEGVEIKLQTNSREKVHWYLDGRYLGIRPNGSFLLVAPGHHSVYSLPEGDETAAHVQFTVSN